MIHIKSHGSLCLYTSSSSLFFSFSERQRRPLACQASKEVKTRTGQSSGNKKSVKIQRGEASTDVEFRGTSPPSVHVLCYWEKKTGWNHYIQLRMCCLFSPTFFSYVEKTQGSVDVIFEFQISEAVSLLFLSLQLSPSIQQPTCTQKQGIFCCIDAT